MRLHKKHPIEKCTENTHLKLRYKINGTFLRHSVYTFVLQNINVHLLKITCKIPQLYWRTVRLATTNYDIEAKFDGH